MLSGYDLYVFFLCLVVFVLLTVLSAVMLTVIVRLTVRIIRTGEEDEKILKEYLKAQKTGRKSGGLDKVVTLLFGLFFFALFAFSIFLNVQDKVPFDDIPVMKVVQSDSMSEKHKNNGYLYENGLNDQFDTFDLIFIEKLPKEEALKLYDIVVYEYDDTQIIHRIIKIETDEQTGEKKYTFRGDNVKNSDVEKVSYSQMKGIYKGKRIPYVGSFISFMQSPAGWLCILLIVIAFVATPIMEKKIEKEREKRLYARKGNVFNGTGTYVTPHYKLDIHVVTEEPEFVKRARAMQVHRFQMGQTTQTKKKRK